MKNRLFNNERQSRRQLRRIPAGLKKMPHKCMKCGSVFEDGTLDILSGCPNCGGKKFIYVNNGVRKEPVEPETPDQQPTPERHEWPNHSQIPVQQPIPVRHEWPDHAKISVQQPATARREWPEPMKRTTRQPAAPFIEEIDKKPEPAVQEKHTEPLTESSSHMLGRVDSVRVLGRGNYELNLERMADSRELIIGVGTDGKYMIDLPSMTKKKEDSE